MPKGNSFISDYLLLVFNNTAIANVGDATGIVGSGAAGSLYVSLHTADPGASGSQTTSEISYTGYARVAVARTSSGWTVAGQQASNAALVAFGLCTAGSGTATHFVVGRASSGTGEILYANALNSSLAISQNVTPQFAAGSLVCNET